MKRLRREQAENERLAGAEAALAENEKHIDEIGKEYSKLKKQRRLQRFQVNIFFYKDQQKSPPLLFYSFIEITKE